MRKLLLISLEEVFVKNSVVRLSVLCLALTLLVTACKGRENAEGGDAGTATIERAKPMPDSTDTDALTQTVSVEDGRSDAEGGVLTNPDPAFVTPGMASTTGPGTTTTTGSPAPPAGTPTATTTR